MGMMPGAVKVSYLIPKSQAQWLRKALSLRQAQLVGDLLDAGGDTAASSPIMEVWVGELVMDKTLVRASPPVSSSDTESPGGVSA